SRAQGWPMVLTVFTFVLGVLGTLLVAIRLIAQPGLGVDAEELFLRELTVCSSWSAGPADMRAALALIASGAIDPLALVTHRLGLRETARALGLQRSGEAVKAVVVP
ncbi:MAG: hypothetical protein ACLGHP_09930, partial [Vicinamibacteria bacterium]